MSKYIIKNCPAIYSDEYCKENTYEDGSIHCQDCTDCVLKQVVEFYKNIEKDHYWGMREIRFSQEILKLLDIEEIE